MKWCYPDQVRTEEETLSSQLVNPIPWSCHHSLLKSDLFLNPPYDIPSGRVMCSQFFQFVLKKRKQWQTWEVVPGAFFWSTQTGGSKKEPFGPVPASVLIHMVGTVLWTSGPVPARPAGNTPTPFLAVFSSAIIVTLKSGCIQKGPPLCTYKACWMNRK